MPNDIPNSTWNEIDASNTSPVPNGAPEGWFPSDVNNVYRMGMGATKRFWDHLNPTATTGGTTTAYTLTYTVAPQQLWDREIYSFIVNATCGVAPTLNINSLGAKSLRKWTGAAWAALSVGDLVTDQFLAVYYNPSGSGSYDIIAGFAAGAVGIAGGSLAGTYPNPTLATARVSSVAVQTFTTSGTYTPAANMLFAIIECVGGGGGGGGVNGATVNAAASGGGGAGSYASKRVTAADVGVSKAVTIGAGGNGGTAGANNGSAGGDTSVGTLCIGKGGSGGVAANPVRSVWNGAGGAGGVAGTGDAARAGVSGGAGTGGANGTTSLPVGGAGGTTLFGGGAASVIANSSISVAGVSAPANTGGGGGGAIAFNIVETKAGGNGAAGFVRITEYIGTT